MKKRNLNGSSRSFDRDELLNFDEKTHTYTLKNGETLTPVSTVIEMFFKPFDAEYWSLKKCNNDPVKAEALREEWEAKGAMAREAGTFMHKTIENFINDAVVPDSLSCQVNYEGNHFCMHKRIDISREWEFFIKFHNSIVYQPFRTEWCVFDEDARIAGTIDLLCECSDGSFEIYDWKRSNKIDPGETSPWNKGSNGLEHLDDTSFNHYMIQQNLYRHILENRYGLSVKRMRLVVLHPEKTSFQIIEIPRRETEISIILHRIKGLKDS